MLKLSKKELKELFSKKNLPKTKIDNVESTKKQLGINVKDNIINPNYNSTIDVQYDENYISIVFFNARLLSVNQIFSILQYRKYDLFPYKTMWQDLIKKALLHKQNLPVFTENCEIILFRQSEKLVDTDALSVMFKFIIDALKYNNKTKNNFILSEDNPNVVNNIKIIQKKGKENIVGIRIQRNKIINNSSIEDFLNKKII